MKKFYIILIIFLISGFSFGQKAIPWKYEISLLSESNETNYLIKVWTYSKKPVLDIEKAKMNAIHGVIFKGVVGHPALVTDPNIEEQKSDFFKLFFKENGGYSKYVNVTGDGSISMGDRIKTEEGYKIAVIVQINHLQLRKDLEQQGIIKSLNHGF